jgi:hypothetical protein
MEVVMSRNILRSALLVAIVMIALSGITLAQGWGGAVTLMPASAEVYTVLTLTATPLNFGDILSTTSTPVVLDPTNAGNDKNLGGHGVGTHAAGTFHIAGTAGKAVSVTFPGSLTLNGSISGTMTWALSVSAASTNAGARGGVAYTSGNALTLSGTGDYYLWVGGSLGTLTNQAAGVYTGSASFDVEYN